jgi:hypothetical protein
LSKEGRIIALSSEGWRDGASKDGALISIEGLLALLSGLEKLNAGRGRPDTEYSDDNEGERGIEGCAMSENGE